MNNILHKYIHAPKFKVVNDKNHPGHLCIKEKMFWCFYKKWSPIWYLDRTMLGKYFLDFNDESIIGKKYFHTNDIDFIYTLCDVLIEYSSKDVTQSCVAIRKKSHDEIFAVAPNQRMRLIARWSYADGKTVFDIHYINKNDILLPESVKRMLEC